MPRTTTRFKNVSTITKIMSPVVYRDDRFTCRSAKKNPTFIEVNKLLFNFEEYFVAIARVDIFESWNGAAVFGPQVVYEKLNVSE